MYMSASGESELRKFSHFYIIKLIFLSYFVGTSDTLSVQMTCLSAYITVKNFAVFLREFSWQSGTPGTPVFSQPHIVILQSSVNLQVPVIDHLVI